MENTRKKCEVCGIVFREKDIVINGIQTKKAEYNTRSEENGNRCIGCLNFEERIKTVCTCGNHINNTKERYINNGNTCSICMNRVNRVLDIRKDLSYAQGLRDMMTKELENRKFNRAIRKDDKETKPKRLVKSLAGFTDEYLQEKLDGDEIEKDIQILKNKIDIIYKSMSLENKVV